MQKQGMPVFIQLQPRPLTTNMNDFFLEIKKEKGKERAERVFGSGTAGRPPVRSREESSLSVARFGVSVRGLEISPAGVGLSGRRSFRWREDLKIKKKKQFRFISWLTKGRLEHFLPKTERLLLYQQIKNAAIWAGQTIGLHQSSVGKLPNLFLQKPICEVGIYCSAQTATYANPVVATPGSSHVALLFEGGQTEARGPQVARPSIKSGPTWSIRMWEVRVYFPDQGKYLKRSKIAAGQHR